MGLSLFVIAALVVIVALLASRVGALRQSLAATMEEARRRTEVIERELAELRKTLSHSEQEHQALSRFLREFPHLIRGLHSGIKERELPGVLAHIVARSIEPRHVIVLVRRRPAENDPARGGRLVVAAVEPADGTVAVGTEVPLGHGELGYAAETQRVMSRHDFEGETTLTRTRLAQQSLPGFQPDFVAPMVLEQETLGALAVAGSPWTSEDAKSALRLIAQAGAQAVYNVAAYSEMKTTADVDGLTKIYNKRHMTQTLAELVHETRQHLTTLAVFLFDIDNFKHYNDTNGHVAGDKLLQMLAQLVRENVRKDDVFGRFGGEEFLLILPQTKLPQALSVAYKVRAAIAAHRFPFAERQPLGMVSVSGGVAEFPYDASDSTGLLRAADEALYEAKRQGRNRVLAAMRQYLGE